MSRKGKGKQKWTERAYRLPDNSSWKCPDGYRILVLDRGAVRINIPDKWEVVPGDDGSIKVYDAPPPKDDCVLAVSYLRLPPGIDWTDLPLSQLLEVAVHKDPHGRKPHSPMVTEPRTDIEVAWQEMVFTDPVEKREARSRIAFARGHNIQALMTLDFWPADGPRIEPAWKEVMRSVDLGRYVRDPLKGDVLH
jgi:hypothetical protein